MVARDIDNGLNIDVHVHEMPDAPIHTLRDLLLLNGQDTLVSLFGVIEEQNTPKTSSFSLPTWDPERLPPSAHLFEDLPFRIHEHLGAIIDQHYSEQAARTSFTNRRGRTVAPNYLLEVLRDYCASCTFNLSCESKTGAITEHLSVLVKVVYATLVHAALTGNYLDVDGQGRTSDGAVITDHIFQVDHGIKILWADKSSRAFDGFIGELMGQVRDGSAVELCTESVATTYHGYKAILAKVRVCLCQISPV
jgi:hypothetical protein